MLLWLIAILLIGGALAWCAERWSPVRPRQIALAALLLDLLVILIFWTSVPEPAAASPWLARLEWEWIPRFGISFLLAMDGLSFLLIVLTLVLGILAVAASWTEIEERTGFFYFNLVWTLAGVVGVFLALDLFLFFFFWEVMLVPMYFVISIWGHEARVPAAIKFFIFTQGSSLLMLIALLALVLVHYRTTGEFTFNYFELLDTPMTAATAMWIMLGFFIAFAVKLPTVPFHTWLPDAHTEAPTGGSVILAGVLLKTGAYGLLRFVVPLFPEAAIAFTPYAMALGVLGILYGAVLAFAQNDLKRLVAYTSVSHMGFVLLGVFAWNTFALQGTIMQMIAHGLSTGALFILAGLLQERLHTRDLSHMGGFWAGAPRLSAMLMFFAVASLGLPGLGNFIGEFLVLLGAYQVSVPFAALAALGLIAAVIYALILVQRSLFGEPREGVRPADLGMRELAILAVMAVGLVWLGLYPQPVFDTAAASLAQLQESAGSQVQMTGR